MIAPILYLLLALVDLFYTRFMLGRYGVGIEQNPVIPWLALRFGLDGGTLVGIMAPTLVICIAGFFFHPLIEVLTFFRLILFFLQASHLRTEICHYPRKIAHN